MKKKIALILVLVMLVNMIAWADDSDTVSDEDAFAVLVVIGVFVLVSLLVTGIVWLVDLAEADSPDDGIRLASMENIESVLQHLEVGQVEKDKLYVGLRFRF